MFAQSCSIYRSLLRTPTRYSRGLITPVVYLKKTRFSGEVTGPRPHSTGWWTLGFLLPFQCSFPHVLATGVPTSQLVQQWPHRDTFPTAQMDPEGRHPAEGRYGRRRCPAAGVGPGPRVPAMLARRRPVLAPPWAWGIPPCWLPKG